VSTSRVPAAGPSLCIAHVDSELRFSGGEVQVFLLMEGLRALGWRNLLVCRPDSRAAAEAAARGFDTRVARMQNDLDLAAVPRLTRIFRESGADLVHLHTGRATWLGGLAAWFAALPAVTTRRMDRRVKRNWRTRLIYGRLVRQAVAISPAVAAALAAGGVAPTRTVVIPSAVDPRRVEPAASRATVRASLGLDADTPVLLVLAALVRRKGIDVLLRAVARLGDRGLRPQVWVAGAGPERGALADLARHLGVADQVAFLGRRDDGANLLAGCDVVVIPSRREGLGVAALEAMAAGRPVVASRVGGLADVVVDGRTGLLVPPDDDAALATALARILEDDEARAAWGRAGPERVGEGFLPSQMVAAYVEVYRTVYDEWGRR